MFRSPNARQTLLHLACVLPFTLLAATSAKSDPFENRSSAPKDLFTFRNVTYFSADDGIHGRELWRSNGTKEGTWMVRDTIPGSIGGNPEWFTATEDTLFFVNLDPVNHQRKLWKSDGTENGTVPVLSPPLDASRILRPMSSNGKHVFCVTEDPGFSQLVRTDGTDTGTRIIESDSGPLSRFRAHQAHAQGFLHVPGETLFTMGQSELYRLADGNDTAAYWGVHEFTNLFGMVGGQVLLSYRSHFGRELMALTDIEPADIVRDIWPGEAPGIDVLWHDFAVVGNFAYFVATDGIHGGELWRSDGTEAGTIMLCDIYEGENTGRPGILTEGETLLYFSADDGIHGHEPWVTDGTPEGTRLLFDVNVGPRASSPYRLHTVGDTLYFSAANDRLGEELWRSDGSPTGTFVVRDIVPGPGSAEPYYKATQENQLLFTANDGQHGFELWTTDGTDEGTRLVKDIAPVMGINPSSNLSQLQGAGDRLYFTRRTPGEGTELWCHTIPNGETALVKDLFFGPASSNPSFLCTLGDSLLFSAETPNEGIELWKTDGTASETILIRDIVDGAESSSPTAITAIDDTHAVFAANDGINGVELWITDGTSSGTRLLKNIQEDPGVPAAPRGSFPRNFTRAGTVVYFTADDGIHGDELWVTDGTLEGTAIVADVVPRYDFSADY